MKGKKEEEHHHTQRPPFQNYSLLFFSLSFTTFLEPNMTPCSWNGGRKRLINLVLRSEREWPILFWLLNEVCVLLFNICVLNVSSFASIFFSWLNFCKFFQYLRVFSYFLRVRRVCSKRNDWLRLCSMNVSFLGTIASSCANISLNFRCTAPDKVLILYSGQLRGIGDVVWASFIFCSLIRYKCASVCFTFWNKNRVMLICN